MMGIRCVCEVDRENEDEDAMDMAGWYLEAVVPVGKMMETRMCRVASR